MGVGRHFRQSDAKRPTATCEGLETRRLFTVLYVDINKNASSNPGVWATASTSLQATINASVAGDEIRVADGTYLPSTTGDRTASFVLKSGVTLTGGWAGRSSVDPTTRDPLVYVTKLSGNIGSTFSATDNSYRVVTGSSLSSTTILDGFTIGDAYNDNGTSDHGGGLYINQSSSPTVRYCTFTSNVAGAGAAIFFDPSSSSLMLSIDHCAITANTSNTISGHKGGGVVSLFLGKFAVSDCTFRNNTSTGPLSSGGALSVGFLETTISNSSFINNHSDLDGGAIYSGRINLYNCIFTGNSSSRHGGGVSIFDTSVGCILSGCTFSDNAAATYGGAAYISANNPTRDLLVSNCTFTNNSASEGGALFMGGGKSRNVTNCTFTRNTSVSYGAAMRFNGSSSSPGFVTSCAFNGNRGVSANVIYATFAVISNSSFVGGVVTSGFGWGTIEGNSITLSGSTFTKNPASWALRQSSPATTNFSINVIVWGSSSSGYSTTVNPTNSDIEDSAATGPGVIHADPKFVRTPSPGADTVWGTADDDYGDLRLQATSPCIDAGSNAYVPTGVTTDLAGQARFADVPGVRDPGVITDMGAYEAATSLAVSDRSFLTDATLPTAKFVFNANLATSTLNGGDLQLLNQSTGDLFDTSTLATTAYDLATFSASWLLPTNLPDGNYHATLPAGSIADAGSNPLTSSDQLDFFILAGDANRDRFVDTQDFNLLAANFGGGSKAFSQGDFNYSTVVDSTDFDILTGKYGMRLAVPSAPVGAVPAGPSGSIFAPGFGNRENTDDSLLS